MDVGYLHSCYKCLYRGMNKLIDDKDLFTIQIATIIISRFILFQVIQSQFLCLLIDLFFQILEVMKMISWLMWRRGGGRRATTTTVGIPGTITLPSSIIPPFIALGWVAGISAWSVVPLGLVAFHFSLCSLEKFLLLLLVVLVLSLFFLSELFFPFFSIFLATITAWQCVKFFSVWDLKLMVSSLAFQGDFVVE